MEEDTCSICHDPLFGDGIDARKLACGHEFHRACIHTWYYEHAHTCPLCRAPIGARILSPRDEPEPVPMTFEEIRALHSQRRNQARLLGERLRPYRRAERDRIEAIVHDIISISDSTEDFLERMLGFYIEERRYFLQNYMGLEPAEAEVQLNAHLASTPYMGPSVIRAYQFYIHQFNRMYCVRRRTAAQSSMIAIPIPERLGELDRASLRGSAHRGSPQPEVPERRNARNRLMVRMRSPSPSRGVRRRRLDSPDGRM